MFITIKKRLIYFFILNDPEQMSQVSLVLNFCKEYEICRWLLLLSILRWDNLWWEYCLMDLIWLDLVDDLRSCWGSQARLQSWGVSRSAVNEKKLKIFNIFWGYVMFWRLSQGFRTFVRVLNVMQGLRTLVRSLERYSGVWNVI